MELVWLVLTLLAVDLAAFAFAADTRPGLQHTSAGAAATPPVDPVSPGASRDPCAWGSGPGPTFATPGMGSEPGRAARAGVGAVLGGGRLLRRHPVPPPAGVDRRLLEPGRRRAGGRRRPRDRGDAARRDRVRLGPRGRGRRWLRPDPVLPRPGRGHHVDRRPDLGLRRRRSGRRRPPHRQPARHPRRPRCPHRRHRRHPRLAPHPAPGSPVPARPGRSGRVVAMALGRRSGSGCSTCSWTPERADPVAHRCG